ncbi:selenophosphate synthase [Salsuginibacillus halophilus]|uniref:Selenide, water dikinase n=1 Tax=Salsuginibacillus halophilus TaxID=517424 RepID=A0A2P8HYK8_9BACI|nr:selenophosphate synthase [Salsuginibacillus halophilus]
MRFLPEKSHDPNLLVGTSHADDGGVYKLTDDLAIVQSVDYFTPIVDDPYKFGEIAAANALSDIYAMGGTPKTALNIVGYPIKELPEELLGQMLAGMAAKTEEAGAAVAGGHSIDDAEPKLGLSATGVVHPDRIFKNGGAQPGDKLVITKPIGAGILTTAIKRDQASSEEIEAVTETMAALNKTAAEKLHDYHPSAVTDVTGFGLLGHGFEMAEASNVTLSFTASAVPELPGARRLAEEGMVPGGSKANLSWLNDVITWSSDVSELTQTMLTDAITSGGLLVSLPQEETEAYIQDMKNAGETAVVIGEVTELQETSIVVNQ